MGTFFTRWRHTPPEPRAEPEQPPLLSAYRRPSYYRPPRAPVDASQAAVPLRQWEKIQSEPLCGKAHWFTLSLSAHIVLLAVLAAVTLPAPFAGVRRNAPVKVQIVPPAFPVPEMASSEQLTDQPDRPEPAKVGDSLQTLRSFRSDWTERADRLEHTLVQLAEAATTKDQILLRQQQQLALAQEEATRISDKAARRTAQEDALAAQLAEEQMRNAQLEAQIAEQRRQEEAALATTQGTYDKLIADLQKEIANKDITIREANDKLAINIVDRVLFPSGQATLTDAGIQVLEKVGRVLETVPDRRIQIEGHTDNREVGPVLKKTFASNWELSTARATEVVKYLLTHSRLPAERLLAVGRADTIPVASNATEEGRQQNRRIEILLLPPEQTGQRGGGGSPQG